MMALVSVTSTGRCSNCLCRTKRSTTWSEVAASASVRPSFFHKPAGREEILLCVADTYLVSAPGDELTREPTQNFARLTGLPLVLPRRPSHWRNALEETARSLGFKLAPVAEADSLTVQKELVAGTPGLYSVLGPYAFAADLRAGRLPGFRQSPWAGRAG